MENIGSYDSDSEEPPPSSSVIVRAMNSAPMVSTLTHVPSVIAHDAVQLYTNPKASSILAPMHGPQHPFKFNVAPQGTTQAGLGFIEPSAMDDYAFEEQYQTYQRSGYAVDNSNAIVGDVNAYFASGGETAQSVRLKRKPKRKRDAAGAIEAAIRDYDDIGDEESGPWAPEAEESSEVEDTADVPLLPDTATATITAPTAAPTSTAPPTTTTPPPPAEELPVNTDPTMHIIEPDDEEEKWERVNERKMHTVLPPRAARGSAIPQSKTTFHGTELYDYQGRSWVAPPSGVRPRDVSENHDCYIPKKCIKKYAGHTKGVSGIQFSPGTGHLLLSGSMDGKCKIWDVLGDRQVKRTYVGHTEGVKSLHMCHTGFKFLSSGYDRVMRMWDVETGVAVGTYCNRKMGYHVRFHPTDENTFMMSASDNKIYQWDARTGTIAQEYNYHLQPVNTVTFFDDGRRFLSSSDDKKILVWEYGIPVPSKYIQEPGMHSVTAATLSPAGDFVAGQSMDNSIVVYAVGERVKQMRRRVFRGHSPTSGTEVGFSSNGKFIMSGDSQGQLHVWDFQSTKAYRKFQAHDNGPCVGSTWHPLEPSWVATCGWDGLIKLWD